MAGDELIEVDPDVDTVDSLVSKYGLPREVAESLLAFQNDIDEVVEVDA